MSAVDLSSVPRVAMRSATIRLDDKGASLVPSTGGPEQRIERLGSRYVLDVVLPPLPQEPTGRLFTALLQRALSERALFAVPQPGFLNKALGSPVVDGANLTGGSLLPIRGLLAGSVVRAGQYLSIIHAGQRYLHRAKVETAVNEAGGLVLPVMPLFRTPLADGDVVELAKPYIEGQIDAPAYDILLDPFIETRFSIRETA